MNPARNAPHWTPTTRSSRLLATTLALLSVTLTATAQHQLWSQLLGTPAVDRAEALALDGSGGVYLGGSTEGSLGGPSAGASDAWLGRYDAAGVQLWLLQLGTIHPDGIAAAAPDGAGGVFMGGFTQGSLAGQSAGLNDAWLGRYDAAGVQLWVRQLGTSDEDWLTGAALDGAGGVFVCGSTGGSLGGPSAGGVEVWLAHYDNAGNQLWIQQLGDLGYSALCAQDGSGGVYVSGATQSGPSYSISWLVRFDSGGNRLWPQPYYFHEVVVFFGSAWSSVDTIAADGLGGVYVGTTSGGCGSFIFDRPAANCWMGASVERVDGAGTHSWSVGLPDTANSDWAEVGALAADGSGGVWVSFLDGFGLQLTHYGNAGGWLGHEDLSWGVAAFTAVPDGSGGAYLSGVAGSDAWLTRVGPTSPVGPKPGATSGPTRRR